MAKWRMGPEILYPFLPLCLLHIAWVVLGWAKVRRRWLAFPIAALLSAAILAGTSQKFALAFDAFRWIWAAYLFVFLPFLALRGLVRAMRYAVQLPKSPPH